DPRQIPEESGRTLRRQRKRNPHRIVLPETIPNKKAPIESQKIQQVPFSYIYKSKSCLVSD
ncbi:MAG: hypothetical protein SO115_00685, partial [Sodaliphilus sp.]|nr:hypothetical protein [Bacteroidales bacterium]MDY4910384.1 hypothetical protein [Sodaliphilus sp.]MDY5707368.1 hypothetical protein [Sodaliphilus sp.]